ncbi:CAAX protease self-immunity [Leptospira yanagawae serovar Saopaulo str. Sao Paulo = ATCC 700523]|uniref:CAAX protease self-immunity n=1 Tax=Leptospira yanagawae serovar Saopaulo str. Sao Paulo = ATCC 700523 TaxID=1249483 RepID=A0A5E8HAQ9_9LEPT|nr:CAAX protease self-immunity [Leptospira yanagawae serovar Saopaulo str. Sao Paulo = ATCC 700523]
MNEETKSSILFYFFIFWTFCFLNGFFNPYLSKNLFFFSIMEIVFWILLPIFTVTYFIFYLKVFSFSDLGFHSKLFKKESYYFVIIFSLIFSFFVQKFYFITHSILSKFFTTNYFHNFEFQSTIPNNFETGILLTIYYSFTAGIVEEIYYRGILAQLFQIDNKFNINYILISSILFSVNHWEGGIINIIDTFLYGLLFSIFYNKIKNIWPLIIAHIITAIIAFYPNA